MFLLCAFFLGNYMKFLTKKSFISISFLLVFIALGQFAVRIKKERYMAPALKKDAAALWQAAGVRME